MLSAANPARSVKLPLVERYSSSPLPIVLIEAVAEPSLADLRALSKLGMAIAAMIKMIATTINSSISEKPLVFLLVFFFMISPCRFSWLLLSYCCQLHLLAVVRQSEDPDYIGGLEASATPARLNLITAD